MGFFFRKKKIEVPAPPSEDILKFPKASEISSIKPESIKEAVGIEKPSLPPEIPPVPTKKEDLMSFEEIPPAPPELTSHSPLPSKRPQFVFKKPFFIRMQNYQLLIENLNNIKNKTAELDQTVMDLEKSEFNENKNYERLKNNLKKIHDQLLVMDDTIFKK